MTFQEVLVSLLGRLGHGQQVANITFAEVQRWPTDALLLLITENWLTPHSTATVIHCSGCPENCFKPVHTLLDQHGKTNRHFIACDQNDYMGKIPVQPMQLQQWRISGGQLATWLANKLEVRLPGVKPKEGTELLVGLWVDKKNNCPITLDFAHELSLKLNPISVPLLAVVYEEDGQLLVDHTAILALAKQSNVAAKSRYQSSTLMRELGKQNTANLHADWQKTYRQLKHQYPTKSDTWISLQIAKMDIAQGRNSETIRKNMKA